MSASAAMPWEAGQVIADAARERYKSAPAENPNRDRAICELLESLLRTHPEFFDLSQAAGASYERRETLATELAAADHVWAIVEKIISQADDALTRYPDDGKTIERWWIPTPSKLEDRKAPDPSAALDQLTECAVSYCRAEWAQCAAFERWLVRQMIFSEVYAFGRQAGVPLRFGSWKYWWIVGKGTVKWLIGVAVAFGVGEAYGWPLGVLSYVVWVSLIQYTSHPKYAQMLEIEKTYMSMRHAYVIALREAVSPLEIQRALLAAEERGAVWPTGLHSIVERSVRRNAVLWGTA